MIRVAVCCRVLQCVAVCCSVLQCVAVCCRVLQSVAVCCGVVQCGAVCCIMEGGGYDIFNHDSFNCRMIRILIRTSPPPPEKFELAISESLKCARCVHTCINPHKYMKSSV